MKMIILLLTIVIVFISTSCPHFVESVYRITIQNNSNYTVRYYASYEYPDTSMSQNKPRLLMANSQDYGFWDSKKEWDKILPTDTLSIFIINNSVADTCDWEEIRSDYKILKRYDLSLSDLQSLKWTITYPPTDDMRYIKQYPPYGSE